MVGVIKKVRFQIDEFIVCYRSRSPGRLGTLVVHGRKEGSSASVVLADVLPE
jgi:hypothetical protein